ncbi:MAG: rhodanese-like domain-containing protein [Desulfuromonadaceae bacterium]|nr:rhodanese-like domain-containing protein [Desulfuromonadaceae bacterium]MDD5106966.1 rhodanese-like domain-containing protein [Desulfuromonadaceae bacterium]
MKRISLVLMALLTTVSTAVAANYIEPLELKQAFENKSPLIIIDIQPAKDFAQQHLPGSVETNAFPAKSSEEKRRLDKALPAIKASSAPVVIVCPRGKSGAKNSYEYLLSMGIAEDRLQILDDGIAGWPYKEYFKQGR